jgi:hypothetical protein
LSEGAPPVEVGRSATPRSSSSQPSPRRGVGAFISRRAALTVGGGLLLAGCDKIATTAGAKQAFLGAEDLTYRVNRLLTARDALAPFLQLSVGPSFDLGAGFQVLLDAAAETHFLALHDSPREPTRHTVAFALRASLGVGKRF